MQRRCDRNRKRSKRRAIYCPTHDCQLDSVSQKYPLFADKSEQLRERGIRRRQALMLMASNTTIALPGEWLEAFWCDHCQESKWYHVRKSDQTSGHAVYSLSVAPSHLWQQVSGVVHPQGNPSVSEFTRRQARMVGLGQVRDFRFV